MDPFTTLQNNMQRDNITREMTGIFRQFMAGNQAEALATIERLENRTQGIAPPVQAIQNFEFQVPEHALEQIFQRQHYTRPKPMIHFRTENGKNFFNNNVNSVIWDDPDRVGYEAREAFRAANVGATPEQLQAAYNEAKIQQHQANRDAEQQPPDWVLCQRTENNDTRLEDTIIRFLDDEHKQVDWHATITNLHDLGRDLGYTLPHYNRVMNRFVTHFNPSISSLINGMNANETARFLQSLNTPIPNKQRHFKAIRDMNRPIGKELRTVMSELHVRAKGYYADQPQAQRENMINNMMIQGLQAFTSGQTNMNLRASIQQQILEDQPLQWSRMQETAILSEETWGKPTVQLQFMPNNQQTSFFNTVPVFNASIQPVDPFIRQMTPLVTPLVFPDPRVQQQFYTAPMYNQANQQHNGFFNMQDPMMPLQPPALNNAPAVGGQQANVNIPPNAPLAGIQQAPQVPVHQPAGVLPQVAVPPAQLAAQQAQQAQVPQAAPQAVVPVPQGQPAQVAAGVAAAAAALARQMEEHQQRQQARQQQLVNNAEALQADVEALQALQALQYQDDTPPNTPRDQVVEDQQQNQYHLRNLPGRNNNEHRRHLENQAFNNNVVAEASNTQSSALSPLIQTILKQDKALQNLQSQVQSLSVNSTNMQQNMPPQSNVAPANRPYNNYRAQTPPRQPYQQYNNQRPVSPGGNRDGRNGAPPPQGNNQYRARTPPYQGSGNYYRQQTPPRYNQYGNNYNNADRARTPPRDNTYSYSRESTRNYDRSRSPGYGNRQSRSDYQYRPYSPNQYRPQSPRPQYRPQSPRPQYRPQSPGNNSYRQDRNRSQSPGRNFSRGRSPGNQSYKRDAPILVGVNCNPNYSRQQGLLCTKCNTYGKHEEHTCPTYYHWAPRACFMCKNGFHMTNDCTNIKRDRTPDRSSPKPNGTHLKN